jgi:hypothetical protein
MRTLSAARTCAGLAISATVSNPRYDAFAQYDPQSESGQSDHWHAESLSVEEVGLAALKNPLIKQACAGL